MLGEPVACGSSGPSEGYVRVSFREVCEYDVYLLLVEFY